jgi:hypothetical protein
VALGLTSFFAKLNRVGFSRAECIIQSVFLVRTRHHFRVIPLLDVPQTLPFNRLYSRPVHHCPFYTLDQGVHITGTVVKEKTLLSPNKTQLKMYNHFDKLMDLYSTDPCQKNEILRFCNKVNGLLTALKIVESNRDLTYIQNKVKEIRNAI